MPTAPESLPTATTSRTCRNRDNARENSSCISANLSPKVVGSPWIPWLRPMQGVSLCSLARRAITGSSVSTSRIRMSALWTIWTAKAVSTMSELVRPKCSHRLARSSICSATAVVKPITSWLRVFSSSLARSVRALVSAKHFSAPAFILARSAAGTMPARARASLASISIWSQILRRFSSVQMARISGRE